MSIFKLLKFSVLTYLTCLIYCIKDYIFYFNFLIPEYFVYIEDIMAIWYYIISFKLEWKSKKEEFKEWAQETR